MILESLEIKNERVEVDEAFLNINWDDMEQGSDGCPSKSEDYILISGDIEND